MLRSSVCMRETGKQASKKASERGKLLFSHCALSLCCLCLLLPARNTLIASSFVLTSKLNNDNKCVCVCLPTRRLRQPRRRCRFRVGPRIGQNAACAQRATSSESESYKSSNFIRAHCFIRFRRYRNCFESARTTT